MTALLSVEGLRLGYARADVVHGIGLAVQRGSIVSLIGSNGAGKTTILRSLSGLMKPRAGSVRWSHGETVEIAGEAAHRIARRGIVQVPEGRQVFANMTVAENLRLGAYHVATPEAARRQEAVVARFPRLGERLRQQAGYLSGGEQQMLAMGRALMAEPVLLLLDEPSMGLAPLIVEEIFAIIASLRAEGRTILLVEQNASAALAIADYAYVLETGRIRLQGEAAEVARNPEVTAAYLGV
ncbi:High-affinity branched-chain amino acid transport ATP-binding protein LivF [Methylobacterium crusticola]|uniref:High-affinity branched-chain amino acid transport ATP-binding protein LivF n=1 Tax=Methylobacterium crusticola TaxID=1697972 RepID=A0ABQ4R405_9HYPH|nr:ABC transporter ATP-binding protein [Methylobacterium crusticola]GJD51574.1 High-affinity branched-chain amino acid transport ATP-binding protein LivF [Methylobacterium crusticola]